jgi:hypothetical protein
MNGVTIKDKCNADIRCQHQEGCGCLARGQTCDHTPLPKGYTESGKKIIDEEADDGLRAERARESQRSSTTSEPARKHRLSDRDMPGGEKVHVVNSDGKDANNEPVDDNDPLGIIKAMNAKITDGGHKKSGHADAQDGGDATRTDNSGSRTRKAATPRNAWSR